MNYIKRPELLKPFLEAIRQQEPILLCALGDSNTCNANFTSGGKQWFEHLHSELRNQYNTQSILALNSGISGNTILDGLKRFHTDVGRFRPDCCIIAMGSNDSNKITNDEFRDGMRRCIDRLLTMGTQVVIRTTQPVCEWEPAPGHIWSGDVALKERNQVNEELADEYQVSFVDVYRQWCDWEKKGDLAIHELMYDAVHYNTAGHQQIYRSIAPLFSLTPDFYWERDEGPATK